MAARMLRAPFRVASLAHCKEFLKVTWQDGAVSQFPNVWLRNSIRDDNIFDSNSLIYDQKKFGDFAAKECPIVSANLQEGTEDIAVQWEDHKTSFNASWLRARDSVNIKPLTNGQNLKLWDANDSLSITYDYADKDALLSSWMSDLRRYGIAYFKGVPPNETGLKDLLQSIGMIMQRSHPTNHLKVNVDPANTNAIDVHIYAPDKHPVHTDTAYYPAPARLSGLLCTKYQAPAEDTYNYFADCLKVIDDIQKEDPEAFHLLSTVPVRFSRRRMYVQEPVEPEDVRVYHFETLVQSPFIGYDYQEERPMVRFSNKNCGLDLEISMDQAKARRFYEAFKLLESKLSDPKYHQSVQLKEGWCGVFNNYRVVHGRTSVHPTTKRNMMLSFISDITWRTRWRVLMGENSGLDQKWLLGCTEKELEVLADRFEETATIQDIQDKPDLRRVKHN